MKTISFATITAGLAALVTPVYAIEAPEDNAPPPAAAQAQAEAQADAAEQQPEQQQTAFLGVLSDELPEMLAEHLGLEANGGVVVRALEPDGPAAKAGLAVNDIITRIGDKAVGSPIDLTREVQSRKPGDKIRLDMIHKGKAAGIDVTLGTRPDGIAGLNARPLDQLQLNGVPKEMADRIRKAIEGNIGGLQLDIQEGGVEIAPQMDEAMKQMRERMQKALEGLDAKVIPGMPNIEMKHNATVRVNDPDGSVELSSSEGGKEVTIRDKDNKITWTGPWDTEQDKAAAPEDVRKRVERLNIDSDFKGNGLRLRMGGGLRMPEE